MTELLGASLPVFLGLTVILFGGAGVLTGQAMAHHWRGAGWVLFYALLLGLGDRFLIYALFGGALLSLWGYLLHTAVIAAIALLAWRVTRVHKMVCQYPWLYEHDGLLRWRDKRGAA